MPFPDRHAHANVDRSDIDAASETPCGVAKRRRHSRSQVAACDARARRIQGDAGLRLTVRQAAELFSFAPGLADAVLHELRRAAILTCSNDGAFASRGACR